MIGHPWFASPALANERAGSEAGKKRSRCCLALGFLLSSFTYIPEDWAPGAEVDCLPSI